MPNWTTDQQHVIDTHGCDILVSAAAGSGKTAVLVERIIQMIMDEKHPVDVDRLLVVTFTRAAAQEMRERIRNSLSKVIAEETDTKRKARLERQKTLLSHAKIMTIDSFCGYVVKNHFDEIGMDPGYRIADQSEMEIFEQEVMDEFLNLRYEESDEDFLHLVDTYGKKNQDTEVVDMILKLVHESESYPWPKDWILSVGQNYEPTTVEELKASPWVAEFEEILREVIRDALVQNQRCIDASSVPEGAPKDHEIFANEKLVLEDLLKVKKQGELIEALSELKFVSMPGGKAAKGVDADLRKEIRDIRKTYVDSIKAIIAGISGGFEVLLSHMNTVRPYVNTLISLALSYQDYLTARKLEENLLNFSDVEHAALRILLNEDGTLRPVAEELQEQFVEVMIDEYQDSNDVQEAILSAIARKEPGQHNYFMVGDVKQSIYGFRQARPQIFMEKLKEFAPYPGEDQTKILLGKNFRSREEVIRCVNASFRRLMGENLGNIDYDKSHELNLGAEGYPAAEHGEYAPELLLGDLTEEEETAGGSTFSKGEDRQDDDEDLGKVEFEARMIAGKIRKILDFGMVTDQMKDPKKEGLEHGTKRPAEPRDIAILLRATKTTATIFQDALALYGIPSHVVSEAGYFTAIEVETVLSFLEILENPLQDIPLTAVLHSPMFSVSEDDLAEVRIEYPDESFSEGVFHYISDRLDDMHDDEDDAILQFYKVYQPLRQMMSDVSLHEIIQMILKQTGYQAYMNAIPNGAVRSANLDKLVDTAISFEHTGRASVHAFVDYIHQLKKYEKDSGNAELIGEEENCVRIMTIHKSKGLEFPIVFLSRTDKGFNTKDATGTFLVNSKYGIALNEVKGRYRVRRKSMYDFVMSYLIKRDNLGEELRILYVAMTRAKEKLIFTGMLTKTLKDKLTGQFVEGLLPYSVRYDAKSYLELLIQSLGVDSGVRTEFYNNETLDEGLTFDEESERMALRFATELSYQEGQYTDQLEQQISTKVTRHRSKYKNKYSVSELKHAAMKMNYHDENEEDVSVPDFIREKTRAKTVPAFLLDEATATDADVKTGKVNQGALRGTAMHRVMELLSFTDKPDLSQELREMEASGKLAHDEAVLILPDKISHFIESNLYERMARAHAAGNLFREAPFVMGKNPQDEPDEMVLIQGIIDAYFIEDEHAVLVDYKTDRVKEGQELIDRYKEQVKLYKEAIERATSLPVEEAVLYSFSLNEEVKVSL